MADIEPPGGGEDGGGLALPQLTLSGEGVADALALACLGLGEIADGKWGVQLHGKLTTVSLLGMTMTKIEMEPSGEQILPVPLAGDNVWARLIQYDDHKGKPNIPTESGVLKPWMLSTMLNAIAAYGELPDDVFLYQDPITKTTIAWWVDFTNVEDAIVHWRPAGVFRLGKKAKAGEGEEKTLQTGFGQAAALAGVRVRVHERSGYWGDDSALPMWEVDGGKIYGTDTTGIDGGVSGEPVTAVWRMLDHTPNGKKALFALAKNKYWNSSRCYVLAEFEASGSLADATFTVTPRVAMTAAETMGPCTVNRTSVDGLVTLTYQSGSVYSAYYDADGDIEVVRFVCEMQAANRFRPESDEHTLLLESETRMTVAWEAGSQRQSSSITARLALAQNRGDESNSYTGTAYYSGGGVTIDETEVGDENVTALLDALSVEVFLKQARDVLQLPFMTPAGSQYEHGNQRARCVRTGVLYARASGASLLEARGVVMSGPYTPGAPVLAVEWGDSPTQYGIMGRFTQHIFAPRCFGFVQYDLTPEADGRNYRLGAIVTPTQTLPAETAPGSWETRKRYVAWRPVTGEVLQDVNPCAWF